MKKTKAFTLMEMGIAMLISAIVIGMAYTIYQIAIGSFSGFLQKNKTTENLLLLDELLAKDFNRASGVFQTDSGITLVKDSAKVNYAFIADGIIRRAAITDTFKFNHTVPSLLFEGQPIDQQATEAEDHRIDELSFTLLSGTDSIPYHYYKIYSSANLIERPNHANH
ncbi:pilin/secretion family protein with methylation motif [Mucilaginibacter yixingensis]|uniref:Pilin/secretion family protein with methylation motif n=1 Tax=Mucilaginibacter yixingensis TaxID=1295612 RepID=A0A2T5J4L0_9SPHI|nr:prepilin-type N-terminal cleavage/methylation domain-containing protein [Mucilaginibacter yixingensis]PTQ92441.1 pilin/secretion family protein with methylation motif [Mucilaginibacter yixingensis]